MNTDQDFSTNDYMFNYGVFMNCKGNYAYDENTRSQNMESCTQCCNFHYKPSPCKLEPLYKYIPTYTPPMINKQITGPDIRSSSKENFSEDYEDAIVINKDKIIIIFLTIIIIHLVCNLITQKAPNKYSKLRRTLPPPLFDLLYEHTDDQLL